MPAIPKNTQQDFSIELRDIFGTLDTATTGAPTVNLCKDGTWAVATNAATNTKAGYWKVTLTAAEMNFREVIVEAVKTGFVTFSRTFYPEPDYTPAKAVYLDATISSRSTYAGGDTAGVTTLLTRIGSSITISSGRVNADAVYWGGAAVSSSNSPGIPSVEWTPWGYKTAQTSGASTITLATADRSEDNFYQGTIIAIIAGTGKYQARNVLSYVGATRVATVDKPWIIAPDNTSIYAIYPSVGNMIASLNDLSPTEVADAVWDDLVMDHVDAGTFGLHLGTIPTTSPPSVQNIVDGVWDEAIAGHLTAGSTGEALDTASQGGGGGGATAQEIWEYATRTLTSVGTVVYLGPVSPTSGVVTIYRDYAYKTVYGNALAWSSDDWPTITGCTPKLLIGGITISGTLTVSGSTRTVTFEIDDTISATIALTAKSYKVYADFASPDDNVILTTGPAVIIANG